MTENEQTTATLQTVETMVIKQTDLTPTQSRSMTPSEMLSFAVGQNADVAKIEKLMQLQQEWEKNESRKAYVEAMVKFRAACPPIAKTRKVDFTSGKGRTQYTFAGLPETVEQIRTLMAECQLAATWTVVAQTPEWIEIRCDISHVRGHRESMQVGGPPDNSGGKNAIQMIASTITYLRRVTLFSLLGLVAGDEVDDDGAGGKPVEPAKPPSSETLGDVTNAKRNFAKVCLQKTKENALPPAVMLELLAEAQRLSGTSDIDEAADWFKENGETRKIDGKWTIVPVPQG